MSNRNLRLTYSMLRILLLFLRAHKHELYGRTVMKTLKASSGVVYPTLRKFTRAGWLKSVWEKGTRKQLRRPRRCTYKMTADGIKRAESLREELIQLL